MIHQALFEELPCVPYLLFSGGSCKVGSSDNDIPASKAELEIKLMQDALRLAGNYFAAVVSKASSELPRDCRLSTGQSRQTLAGLQCPSADTHTGIRRPPQSSRNCKTQLLRWSPEKSSFLPQGANHTPSFLCPNSVFLLESQFHRAGTQVHGYLLLRLE